MGYDIYIYYIKHKSLYLSIPSARPKILDYVLDRNPIISNRRSSEIRNPICSHINDVAYIHICTYIRCGRKMITKLSSEFKYIYKYFRSFWIFLHNLLYLILIDTLNSQFFFNIFVQESL